MVKKNIMMRINEIEGAIEYYNHYNFEIFHAKTYSQKIGEIRQIYTRIIDCESLKQHCFNTITKQYHDIDNSDFVNILKKITLLEVLTNTLREISSKLKLDTILDYTKEGSLM